MKTDYKKIVGFFSFMGNIRLKKLGVEKVKTLTNNFDFIYQKYKEKAEKAEKYGDIKFIIEHGRVFIYVVL